MIMSLIDSHCHLDDTAFDADRPAVLARAGRVGVTDLISVGTDPASWERQRRMRRDAFPEAGANPLPRIRLAFGLHPWWARRVEPASALSALATLLEAERVVAIGEVGLDFAAGMPVEATQRALFDAQLDLARTHDLPVILHARKSEDRLLWYLRRRPGLRGVVHGFVGSAQQAERFIEQGFMLGVGGAVTHPRARRLRAVLAGVPADYLLLESDAPHQPGAAHRGERNEPAWITESLAVLARLKAVEEAEMARRTWENARRLFKLDSP